MAAEGLDSYNPSPALAGVGAFLFVTIATIATWTTLRYRGWVLALFLPGIYLECASLVARVCWAANHNAVSAFLIAYCSAIIAPSFLAAGCYMVFGRVIWLVVPVDDCTARNLWVHPRWITPLFVTLDLVSFAIQFLGICALGAAYQSTDPKAQADATSGTHALRFGLLLQLACFVLFAIIALRLMWVLRGRLSARNKDSTTLYQLGVRGLHVAIVISAAIIALRATYRVFEFSGTTVTGSPAAYIRSHEWPYWVFDALPAFLVSSLLTVFHPGAILPPELCRLRCSRSTITDFQQRKNASNVYCRGQLACTDTSLDTGVNQTEDGLGSLPSSRSGSTTELQHAKVRSPGRRVSTGEVVLCEVKPTAIRYPPRRPLRPEEEVDLGDECFGIASIPGADLEAFAGRMASEAPPKYTSQSVERPVRNQRQYLRQFRYAQC